MKRILLISIIFVFFSQPALAAGVKNIDVPFTAQAPDGWYSPFDEACEEAATVMLDNFYQGNRSIANPKQEILDIVYIENQLWGMNKDTNALQMTHIINNFFAFEADTKPDPTLAAIKNEIDNNRPVLVPVYGRSLYNPNFRGAGPIYHVIIIKGYDDPARQFITNEPGTVHGHNWRYGYEEMMNAIHDLNYGNQSAGQKIAIFTHDYIKHSGWSDADKDGYTKSEEIANKTSLKVKNIGGNLSVYEGRLLRSHLDPKVYLVTNGRKRHIRSAEELFSLGFGWQDVVRVDQQILDGIPAK
ncbi:MAG: C39 family peptidase [Patescibacteria group bacterium]